MFKKEEVILEKRSPLAKYLYSEEINLQDMATKFNHSLESFSKLQKKIY